ncbi:MAG: tRNA (adenosine(37)-N6)-dimethylallyltransferase MiaA [Defluviitaleaceae bacterium]|nr:tRNA (adenosine(37)-N6)-dimethylallyltransferase MiaA [Defluviitaleaceae bacterium]
MGPLYVIAGPTACKKTETAVELAKIIGGEIVSADSMLVYKKFDIGTVKPTPSERGGIPHHMIDVVSPDKMFSAAMYCEMAKKAIEGIYSRDKVPIIAGGTGFYINALLGGNGFESDNAEANRETETDMQKSFEALAKEKGNAHILRMLREVDPDSADSIHENNARRVARALAFFHTENRRISEHNAAQKAKAAAYDARFTVLYTERVALYDRINKRVDRMVASGLEDEVRGLLEYGYGAGLTSMQGIGYKEMVSHLTGGRTIDEAVGSIKLATRRLAKRQLTWFKKYSADAFWLDVGSLLPSEAALEIYNYFNERTDD